MAEAVTSARTSDGVRAVSHHETPADLEFARDMDVADHEARTHEVRVFPRNDGPFRRHRPSCAICGPIGEWLTDLEDARRAGRRHESSQAQESVAGGVSGGE